MVQDALDNFALIHGKWSHLQVLLANEHLDRALVCKVVLQKVLALAALELSTRGRIISEGGLKGRARMKIRKDQQTAELRGYR